MSVNNTVFKSSEKERIGLLDTIFSWVKVGCQWGLTVVGIVQCVAKSWLKKERGAEEGPGGTSARPLVPPSNAVQGGRSSCDSCG